MKRFKHISVGIIIGIVIFGSIVYAATSVYSANVTYDNSSSGLTSTNVQDALDELYEKTNKCPDGYLCKKYKEVALGDYVSYMPSVISYTTDTSKTNYTSTQIIYPYELDLWRVLKINSNGTVDLISEYVSSTDVYFRGQLGYQNLVGYLNVLASQYETTGITVGSRYFGYNGQTQYITDTSKFTSTAPWSCSTGGACNPTETQGGGDTLYLTDYNQLNTALGTRTAYKVGTTTATAYWIASRYYSYSHEGLWHWFARNVNTSAANFDGNDLYNYYYASSFGTQSRANALRPIVTLSSELKYVGDGTSTSPLEIVN